MRVAVSLSSPCLESYSMRIQFSLGTDATFADLPNSSRTQITVHPSIRTDVYGAELLGVL